MDDKEILDIAEYRNSGKPIQLRPRKTHRFMPPIREWWAATAMALPGKAYHVGAIVWQECRINRSPSCKLTRRVWEKFGLHRHTVRGGLRALEKAGLIRVHQSGKRSPEITIVNDEFKVPGVWLRGKKK
jgi:DNA-binding transcriptional ArsR family regulator